MTDPVLPIHRPKFRTVDGKTLADNFNRGMKVTPDYDWPNRRKFFQDDSPAAIESFDSGFSQGFD